jgi:hypothetical protein
MAFEANARIALPELVYINLDICHNKDEDNQNNLSLEGEVIAGKKFKAVLNTVSIEG